MADQPEISKAAEQAQREECRRSEKEREVNARHEALLEESQRAHFLENSCVEE
jgi:hypothetical protein